MKLRTGFVSNSSSTSFTCDICGRTETGYDEPLEDMGFFECENYHVICSEEAIGDEIKRNEDEDYYISSENCPICQFKSISNSVVGRYIIREHGITREEAFDDIKKINKRRKVLKDFEYIKYAFGKLNMTEDDMLKHLSERFKTYEAFYDYVCSK